MNKMVKLKVIDSVCVGNAIVVKNEVIEVEEKVAHLLKNLKKAEDFKEEYVEDFKNSKSEILNTVVEKTKRGRK